MHLLKKILVVTLIFGSSIYSKEVNEEKPKKKSKNYFLAYLCLSYSLYQFSEAPGYRKRLNNFEDTRENLYKLGTILSIAEPSNNSIKNNFESYIVVDQLTFKDSKKYYNDWYDYQLKAGAIWGITSALYFYLEYRKDDSNTELKSMIIPILNLNSKSAEIGVSITF